jgi:hypothetical protein
MPKRFVISVMSFLAVFMLSLLSDAQKGEFARQPGAVYDADKKGETPMPAPRRDISGIWEPAKTASDGVQATGPKAMPSDGKPEHELPYTPLGRKAFLSNKPTFGVTEVAAAYTNDPVPGCDPQGFPRILLHNFRTSEIVQTANQVLILYEFNRKWRVIWTDGRRLPQNPDEPRWTSNDPQESRWWGYSTGKWVDDYTFVAESNGFDDRSWLDNVGRPHSNALHVIEQYHRADRDHLQISVTIDDPKMYTKPWVAMDKFSVRLQAPSFDIPEMECVPSETAAYNKEFADPVGTGLGNKAK